MPTNPFDDITNRSQEAANAAIQTWTDTVQSLTDKLTGGPSQVPDLQGVVEQYFDLAEQALSSQRAFARQWLSGTVKASAAVTEQAQRATQSVSAHAANAAEAVVDNAAETARVAADTTAAGVPTSTDGN
jgi:plasmid stabilization system protein ParE